MKEHLKSLIKKLSHLSEKLDNTALFTDKKWVLIDNENNQQTHIFKQNGDLIMSKNGKAYVGKWQYLPEAKSILIISDRESLLLNQAFIDSAVMILKYDGAKSNSYFTLADQNQIPDLNVVNYLKLLDYKNRGFETISLAEGGTLVMENSNIGQIEGIKPKNDFYFDKEVKHAYFYDDGKINKYNLKKYKCKSKNINLLVVQRIKGNYYIGDFVFTEDMQPCSDGKYKLGLFKYIEVKNGKIFKAI